MARSIPVLNSPNKYISPSSWYISAAFSYLIWNLGKKYNFFSKTYGATVKPKPSADYIGIKISVLLPTQPLFTIITIIIVQILP